MAKSTILGLGAEGGSVQQRDGLASDAERWCLENKLSMAEREKNKFMVSE